MATSWDRLTHTPANLTGWRLQRSKNALPKLQDGAIVRVVGTTQAGQCANTGNSGRDMAQASSVSTDAIRAPAASGAPLYDEDNLGTARGFVIGISLSVLMWVIGAIVYVAIAHG